MTRLELLDAAGSAANTAVTLPRSVVENGFDDFTATTIEQMLRKIHTTCRGWESVASFAPCSGCVSKKSRGVGEPPPHTGVVDARRQHQWHGEDALADGKDGATHRTRHASEQYRGGFDSERDG